MHATTAREIGPDSEKGDYERLLRRSLGALDVVFQPVVHLESGAVVGHESFIRSVSAGEEVRALELFERAKALGLHVELDWLSMELALVAAAASGRWTPDNALFVNINTSTLHQDLPLPLQMHVVEAPRHAACVIEVSDEQLLADPAGVLRSIRRYRDNGWRVALTGVGATPASLAVVALIEPEVVKLSPTVFSDTPSLPLERIAAAVRARGDIAVVAQGVESSVQAGRAWEVGAQFGQGWWFGLSSVADSVRHTSCLTLPPAAVSDPAPTPLPMETLGLEFRSSDDEAVVALTHRLLAEAATLGSSALVVVHLGNRPDRSPVLARGLTSLAAVCGHLTVAGVGLLPGALPGVNTIEVTMGDPIAGQVVGAVLGPDAATGLVGRRPDGAVEHAITHDATVVASMARSILRRAGRADAESADRYERVLLGEPDPLGLDDVWLG